MYKHVTTKRIPQTPNATSVLLQQRQIRSDETIEWKRNLPKTNSIGGVWQLAFQLLVLSSVGLYGGMALAQMKQVQSVQTMSGTQLTSSSMLGLTASGQSVTGINREKNGSLQNYAGFLAALLLRPDVDHDQDGLCDEIDPDNDNDNIEDDMEILGSLFDTAVPTDSKILGSLFDTAVPTDPNNPDTDGDQLSDSAEYMAGTNPTNTTSVLAITDIRREGSAFRVSWTGGSSARQVLMRRTNLMDPWQPIFANNPPTLTTMDFVDSEATNNMCYYKIVIDPLYCD